MKKFRVPSARIKKYVVVQTNTLYFSQTKKEPAANNSPRLTAKPLSVTDSVSSISDSFEFLNGIAIRKESFHMCVYSKKDSLVTAFCCL